MPLSVASFDHHGLYDAVTRITMLLRLPGQRAGRCDALVSTEDILPTFGELLDLHDISYPLSGASLLPLLNGASKELHPYVVSAESTRQASLALRTLDWKVIQPIVEDAQRRPLPDFYGRPRSPDPLLFDLRSDPGETRDLSRERPEKLAAMLATLQKWREEMARITREPDPIQSQGLTLPIEQFMHRVHARG
jgi:arylsulfatase A-like enzyme